MKIVRFYSYKCARGLAKQLSENNDKRRIYYYSFQIVFGSILKTILLVTIMLLLGNIKETLVLLAFYAGIRIAGGGCHMDDYINCMLSSLIMFIGLGLLVKYTYTNWSLEALSALSLISFIVAVFSAIKYAPAGTVFKPMSIDRQNRRLKKITLGIVLICQILITAFIVKGWKMMPLAGCFGMIMSAFIISPVGYRFFNYINEEMKRLRKYRLSRFNIYFTKR